MRSESESGGGGGGGGGKRVEWMGLKTPGLAQTPTPPVHKVLG